MLGLKFRSIGFGAIALLLLAGTACAQSLVPSFESVFGDESTHWWVSDRYAITPTVDFADVMAVRELSELMNSDEIPNDTNVRLYRQDGDPLVSGVKDEEGTVTLRSLFPQTPSNTVTPHMSLPMAPTTTPAPSSAAGQSLVPEFELVFGDDSTVLMNDGRFTIVPKPDMVDVVAVRELRQLMNSAAIPNGTDVELLNRDGGGALVNGAKDEAGKVSLQSMLPQAPSTGAAITPPRSTPAAPSSSSSTWGAECTNYQRGDTSGVRCRDSSGHQWGSECTSYQSGNTTGVRCRDW